MIRRPPRSTLDRSSAASDVYKRQRQDTGKYQHHPAVDDQEVPDQQREDRSHDDRQGAVSYTHLRAHETVLDLVCRLLLEKKKHNNSVLTLQLHTFAPRTTLSSIPLQHTRPTLYLY